MAHPDLFGIKILKEETYWEDVETGVVSPGGCYETHKFEHVYLKAIPNEDGAVSIRDYVRHNYGKIDEALKEDEVNNEYIYRLEIKNDWF